MQSIKNNQLLAKYTTFKIGGPARLFAEASTLEELQELVRYCHLEKIRYMVLGKGSNTLFDDRGFDGLVILNKIMFCHQNDAEFHVGAGYSFSLLGAQTARKGFAGLEFASGIPGSVGGAVYMNAGANGGETFTSLASVTYIAEDGTVEQIPKGKLSWGYRHSCFQNKKGAIAAATFVLTPSTDAREKQLKIIDYRTKTQPYGDLSAGCVFRNSQTSSAGALIEKSGLKGKEIGGAAVSTVHANFIINKSSATAHDVMELARFVQQTVKEKTGIDLEMEVRAIPYA
jgi:UDP-N-acetylmuramate dehydrogenase